MLGEKAIASQAWRLLVVLRYAPPYHASSQLFCFRVPLSSFGLSQTNPVIPTPHGQQHAIAHAVSLFFNIHSGLLGGLHVRHLRCLLKVALGGCCTVLLPLSRVVKRGGTQWHSQMAGLMVFASSCLFFFLSTPPKIGFETLLQNMVANLEEHVAGKIFGFVGTFITSVDAVLLLAFTVLFGRLKASCGTPSTSHPNDEAYLSCLDSKLETALWIASSV